MTELPLPRDFYLLPTVEVARNLLGQKIVRRTELGDMSGIIVETEAYCQGDPACHAFNGKTTRNSVMYGAGAHCYVYFCYGVHFMMNIVTQTEGFAEAILIRAVMPIEGIELMRYYRNAAASVPDHRLCSGPGLVAKAFAIDRHCCNGLDLTDPNSPLGIYPGEVISATDITTTTRIGIKKAADLPWRFYVTSSKAVSRIDKNFSA